MRQNENFHLTKGVSPMGTIMTLGIDLAKSVFQLHGTDKEGKTVLKKRVSRKKLPHFMANLPACTIGMEACGGAHYWAREFKAMGHNPKLMAPQYVKPYVKTNKNDSADAQACNEAVSRPSMRFVSIKSVEQQDMRSLHRMRSLYIKQRTQTSNHIRGLLLEYGIEMKPGKEALNKLHDLLETHAEKISEQFSRWIKEMYAHYQWLSQKIKPLEKDIKRQVKANKILQNLISIPGMGPINSTALLSGMGGGEEFQNGRQVAAWLGLVPRQCSSGHKQQLLGISKRGDRYLRTMLIHGARAAVKNVGEKTDPHSTWIRQLLSRKSFNQVIVAVANKNARICWALLRTGESYDTYKASNFISDKDVTTESDNLQEVA